MASAEALAAYRTSWIAGGVEQYRLRYEVVCFCPPTVVEVRVDGGRVVEADIDGVASDTLDVLGLYDVALAAYDAEADEVIVRVLPEGPALPVSITIDYDSRIADEEIGYRVLAFETD